MRVKKEHNRAKEEVFCLIELKHGPRSSGRGEGGHESGVCNITAAFQSDGGWKMGAWLPGENYNCFH